jgi:sugar lactone lactonase YvrE
MHIDLFTKTILTLIALLLAVVAIRPMAQPTGVAAQGSGFAGVQFSGDSTNLWAIDTKTGQFWVYDIQSKRLVGNGKVAQLGMPLN